jgi:hypothetical protein
LNRVAAPSTTQASLCDRMREPRTESRPPLAAVTILFCLTIRRTSLRAERRGSPRPLRVLGILN